ncbi:MAG TPA: proton-conducting transporter membrane subunit, partial [bacterium]
LLLVVSLAALFYLKASPTWGKGKDRLFPTLLLGLTGSLIGLLFLRDGFTLYLFFELSLVAAAGLIALGGEKGWLDAFSFLFWGSVSASLLLLGMVYLYAATGTVHLDDLLAQLFASKNYPMARVGGLLLAAAFVYPFCFPRPIFFSRLLNQTSPFLIGLFAAAWVRVCAYLLFIFLFFTVGVPGISQPTWLVVLEYFLALLFLVDFVYAAKQKDFRHAIGYLSVAQLAYLFLGMVVGNKSALTGTLVELLSQVLVTAGLFFIAGNLKDSPGPQPFSRMVGLARHRPLTGICLVIFTASIVGVPPTAGFFGKFYLFQGALEKKDWVVLTAVGVAALFNLLYFVKLTAFLYEHKAPSLAHGPSNTTRKVPFVVLAGLVLLLGIFHQDVIHNFIEPALPKAFLNLPMPNVPFLGKQVE